MVTSKKATSTVTDKVKAGSVTLVSEMVSNTEEILSKILALVSAIWLNRTRLARVSRSISFICGRGSLICMVFSS